MSVLSGLQAKHIAERCELPTCKLHFIFHQDIDRNAVRGYLKVKNHFFKVARELCASQQS